MLILVAPEPSSQMLAIRNFSQSQADEALSDEVRICNSPLDVLHGCLSPLRSEYEAVRQRGDRVYFGTAASWRQIKNDIVEVFGGLFSVAQP